MIVKGSSRFVIVFFTLLCVMVLAGSAGVAEARVLSGTDALPVSSAAASDRWSSSGGIVDSIIKAPIIPDGTTAGAKTDFVIYLDSSLDPDVPGRTLLQGNSIRITLPAAFQFVDPIGFPIGDAGGSPTCTPGNNQCSTGVLLQGWPQHPIRPPFMKYAFSYEASSNTIIYTALEDLIAAPPLEPGIKQMHLILLGFRNPGPGNYPIYVEAETGPNGAVEAGWANVRILPRSRPSIDVTSVFNPGTPNTIYQSTGPGQATPLPYDFLLWDWDDEPFVGVSIQNVRPGHSLLVKDGRPVGHISSNAPARATGHQIASMGPSVPFNAPVLGVPSARLTAVFTAGSVPGRYVVTLALDDGNAQQMIVDVEE